MKKKTIIEAMIPFITNMMNGKVNEEKEPLVFEIEGCYNVMPDDDHIFFLFAGEGISEELEALNPTAEFWAYGENDDILIGTLPLTVEYNDNEGFYLSTQLLEESSEYNNANYTKVFIGNYTKQLDIIID